MYTISKTDVGHLKKSFAKLLVTDISGRDIADYIVERRQQKAAEKTIRNELGTLRGILKKHRRWGAIKDDVRLPKGREDIGNHRQQFFAALTSRPSSGTVLLAPRRERDAGGRGPSPACSDAPKTYGEDPFPE